MLGGCIRLLSACRCGELWENYGLWSPEWTTRPGLKHGEERIVLGKNSWASGTAGVTLCRVQKVLAARPSGMNTDPRLLSANTTRQSSANRHARIIARTRL